MLVTILRGVSGAGKSTYADQLRADVIVSADRWLYGPSGHYEWTFERCQEAHRATMREYAELIIKRTSGHIVVDNTGITNLEVAPYVALALAFGYRVQTVALLCPPLVASRRTTHGLTLHQIVDRDARLRAELARAPSYFCTVVEREE